MCAMQVSSRGRDALSIFRGVRARPVSIRELPRLVRSVGRPTLQQRVPWLPFALVDYLGPLLNSDDRVFEFGGGGSTLWFAERVGSVVTVEHDAEWLTVLASKTVDTPNVTLLARHSDNAYADYIAAIDEFPDSSFAVVVVDGRERVECFRRAIPKIAAGGRLIVDDIERPRYAPVFELTDWPRRVFTGFAHGKPTLAHTVVFTRP